MIRMFHTSATPSEVGVVADVLFSGELVGGQHVIKLEGALGSWLKGQGVVTCASGTDALVAALEGLGVGRGDEVIVPAITFSATAEAVLRVDARPIVADVSAFGVTPCVDQIARKITANTKAVILVHLWGWPALNVLEIYQYLKTRNILLIEDCAQAFGAAVNDTTVGTIGDAAAFSFYPTKPLGGIGDGGAVTFKDRKLVEWTRTRLNHGRNASRTQVRAGYNSRLDAVNAAVLYRRLITYKHRLLHLAKLYDRYSTNLNDFCPWEDSYATPAIYLRPYFYEGERTEIRTKLQCRGIETGVHYYPHLGELNYLIESCPNADKLVTKQVSLPCHAGMTLEDVDKVCEEVSILASP